MPDDDASTPPEAITLEELKTFLKVHDKKYHWLAEQLGVAGNTVNQWLRPKNATPFPKWAGVSCARLIKQFKASATELGRDELMELEKWAEEEQVGPLQLAVRILREEIRIRKRRRDRERDLGDQPGDAGE